jgi:hypothetical protein
LDNRLVACCNHSNGDPAIWVAAIPLR